MNDDDELIRYKEYKGAKRELQKRRMIDKSFKDSQTLKFYPVSAVSH